MFIEVKFLVFNRTMDIKLNRGYMTPETSLVSVTSECGICAGSKEHVVIDDNNTTVNIGDQNAGDDFTLDSWTE